MLKLKVIIYSALVIMAGNNICLAQSAKSSKKDPQEKEQTSESKKGTDDKKEKEIPTIEKFITPQASIKKGMTTVYEKDGKYYININDSLIGRDIRMVSRISKAAEGLRNGFSGYAGDQINSAMLRFEKIPGDKIVLRSLQFRERSEVVMPENVKNSNVSAIVSTFEIKAQSPDKKDNLIDVTSFLMSGSEYIFFSSFSKNSFKLAGLQKDNSYIKEIKTFPINTEFKVVYTYALKSGRPSATFELNSSFVLLPKVPMTPRYADDRVGYFTVRYTDFDRNPQRVETTTMITRWRLEPKPEDIEKYKRGELVEPAKPIVFYIDPATPKEWVPYLIQGVDDWQKVFEKAGFKNAIFGKVAPTFEEDSTWSLDDARYSAIVYKPSDIPNASGPHVNDPRSGEIIESHINWYHNVMLLLRNWYFIQAAPADPAARNMTFDQELMGQLVRFVSSHEVGHTLGLRHNFGGTSHFTVKQLRDPEHLRKYGHTTSIMDYSRFNYVAQPNDNIPQELLFPRLSTYDDWVIEWGYRRFPDIDDPEKELPKINQWIIEKTKDPLYQFGPESNPNDPRFQAEDLGSNQMEANTYGVLNLKYVMKNLITWTSEPNKDYSNLQVMYGEVLTQYKRYMNHVAKWIGGVYREDKTIEQPGARFTHVEKAKQQEAIKFLDMFLFEPQLWLVPDEILNKIVSRADITIEGTYKSTLANILSKRVMLNLINDELVNGKEAYTMQDLYKDLDKIIFAKFSSDKTKATYQRILQKCYVEALVNLYKGSGATVGRFAQASSSNQKSIDKSDITAAAYYQLKSLKQDVRGRYNSNQTETAHYMYIVDEIEKILDENR